MPRTQLKNRLHRLTRGSLRAHLFALVLVSVLPILLFAVLVLNLFARHEKASLATGLRETARALTSAMEREFDATKNALEAVAAMDALDSGDLGQYYRALQRTLQSRPNWKTIVLLNPSGEQVLNLRNPFGEPLAADRVEPESFRSVLQSRRAAPINFHSTPATGPSVGFRVPVLRGSELKYVLSAEMAPLVFGEILKRQKLPAQAVASILDGHDRIVATNGDQQPVGEVAEPLIRSAGGSQIDGWIEGQNRQGVRSYVAFSRSPSTAWSVVLVAPSAQLDSPLNRSLWALGGAGVIFLGAAICGAVAIEARIRQPLRELTRQAEALGRGGPVGGSSIAPVTEVESLGRDIQRAAALLTQRGRERDQAEAALRDLNRRLELRIGQRTEQLEETNSELRREISERHAAEEALRREHVYLNLLRTTELATHDAAGIEALFNAALEQLCGHLGAPLGHCLMEAYHRSAGRTSLWHGDGSTEGRAALESGPAALALETGEVVCFDDLAGRSEPWAGAACRAGLRAAMAIPVRAAGQSAAALAFFFDRVSPADGRLMAVLDQLALQLGRSVERKQAEEALRVSEEQFRQAFDEGPMAICLIAVDRRIVRVNRALCELLECRGEDLLGQDFIAFVHPQERSASEQRIDRLFDGSVSREAAESRLISRPGETLTCCISAALIASHPGSPGYLLQLIEDITQRQRMEEKLRESERLAAVGATSAMLAHEVGNPLNGISTTVQMIERDLARAHDGAHQAVMGALSDIKSEIARLGALLHEFRFLARPQRLELRPVRLADLVREVVAADSYASRGIDVQIDVPATLPLVAVDQEKLKQALANLADNAADAMANGGVMTVLASERDDEILIEVRDTGIGIAPGVNVFELFTTTKQHGTGLGLAVVRQIVSAHGGRVEFQSAPGEGTVFSVALPIDSKIQISQ